MVRAREFFHFVFGLQLENHAELKAKTTSVVITRAKGTGYSRLFIETSILKSSKLRMVTQNASQNLAKISSKSTIVHYTMNICRSFVFRKF